MRAIGFNVKLKPYIARRDGSAKGDWDVGITIDMLECAPLVDTIVLASGDGDFSILLDKLHHDYKLSTEVYSVKALTAHSLINAAQKYVAIDQSLLKVVK